MKRLVLALILLVAAHAAADVPWAAGVSEQQQARANALFSEGNQLFSQLAHAQALEKYKAAVALWDHPMIRFNIAVTLIRLDRMLDAADELEKALRFGAQPFTPELYQQALDYQALLKKQLGYLAVGCDQPDAHIMLDGKPWFDAPDKRSVRVTSGEHSLVAERKGYITLSRRLVIVGGKTTTEQITLLPIDRGLTFANPTPRWIPWTITGAGVAIAAGGVGLWLAGKNGMDRFSQHFVTQCPNGCEADLSMHPALADEQDKARLEGKIGVSMMIGGGAALIGGAIWAIANRPHRAIQHVEVVPSSGGGVTARASWRF